MINRAILSKKISIFTAITLLFTSSAVYASTDTSRSENVRSAVSSNEAADEEVNEEVKEILENEQEFVEKNKEGVDYAAKQALFEAESEEDAERIAESYGGTLKSFDQGIGVVSFDKSIDEVLEDASQSGNYEVPIYANSIIELADDDEADTEAVKYSDASDQWHHSKVRDNPVWVSGNEGAGVKVAVIDNGFLATHEDLKNRVVDTYNFDTKNKNVYAVSGRTKNHGTHVAGIIGAAANGKGIVGVAPQADLMLLQVANSSGSIKTDYLFSALNYAIDNDADVINMSLAYTKISDDTKKLLQEYINKAYNKGCVIIAAAGNEGSSEGRCPAALDHVISVANITSDELAKSSNYGSTVDIAAPGTNIKSCYATSGSAYGNMTGTSMASPIVAGIAALVLSSKSELISQNNSDTADAVISRLTDYRNTDKKTYSYQNRKFTKGCLLASKAVFPDENGHYPDDSGEEGGSGHGNGDDSQDDSGNNPDDSENIENEKIQEAISSNKPYGLAKVSGNAGSVSYCMTYYDHVPYFGRFYKNPEDLGINLNINGRDIPSNALRIKVTNSGGANSSMTITIKKIAGSEYKKIWKEAKTTLRNNTINVTSYPMTVAGKALTSKSSGARTGQVMLKFSKDGSTVKKAGAFVRYHTANGKEKSGMIKIPASAVNYNANTKTASFTGDFNGNCTVN